MTGLGQGEAHWTVEVTNGAVVLRPAVVVPREDPWAYTAEHRAKVERAHRDAEAGREVAVSGSELSRIARLPDDEMAAEIRRLQEEAERGEKPAHHL